MNRNTLLRSDAKDDWEGTQVSLSHPHTKHYRQTKIFFSLSVSLGYLCYFCILDYIFRLHVSVVSATSGGSPSQICSLSLLICPPPSLFQVLSLHFLNSPHCFISCVSSTSPPSGTFRDYTVKTNKLHKLTFNRVPQITASWRASWVHKKRQGRKKRKRWKTPQGQSDAGRNPRPPLVPEPKQEHDTKAPASSKIKQPASL